MNITLNTSELRSSTIAAIIADLMDMQSPFNTPIIKALIEQLEANIGEDEATKEIIDAGVTPGHLIEMWHLAGI